MTISEAVFFWEIFLFSSDQGWLPSMNDSHPERDHLMVVIVVIPNAVPSDGINRCLQAGGAPHLCQSCWAVDSMSACFCFVLYEVTLGIQVHCFEIIL